MHPSIRIVIFDCIFNQIGQGKGEFDFIHFRHYRAETFRNRIETVRSSMPDAFIGVDVIVGFPGETDEDFRQTYDLLESLAPAYLHVFPFSERPGTPAADMPGRVRNVYAHSAGGGKFVAVLQFRKASPNDEGRQRQAALLAFSAFPELKHVFLVDEDVDIFDTNDVLWAMTTRYQGDLDTLWLPGVRGHVLDPTQSPLYDARIPARGVGCKAVFDCTVPFAQKERFRRASFMEVDPARFLPGFWGADKG